MNNKVKTIAGMGLMTAIVVVLQLFGSAIKFGVFSISLTLVPIVIGAALYGAYAGAWLGFVFGMVVLLSGDAASFLAVNAVGTVIVVLVKGSLAGLCAGGVYRLLSKTNDTLAVAVAALVCPVVNTGIFLLGCVVFFLDTVAEWGRGLGFENVATYMLVGFVGLNFLVETGINLVLSPVITRLLKIGKKM